MLFRDLTGRIHHQVLSATVLGERDDLSDIGCSVISITKRSSPKRDPTMGRRAKGKRLQKVPKQFLLLFGIDAEHLKHFGLQILFVYSDAAAADLDTVQHDIVRLGSHFSVFARIQESRGLPSLGA